MSNPIKQFPKTYQEYENRVTDLFLSFNPSKKHEKLKFLKELKEKEDYIKKSYLENCQYCYNMDSRWEDIFGDSSLSRNVVMILRIKFGEIKEYPMTFEEYRKRLTELLTPNPNDVFNCKCITLNLEDLLENNPNSLKYYYNQDCYKYNENGDERTFTDYKLLAGPVRELILVDEITYPRDDVEEDPYTDPFVDEVYRALISDEITVIDDFVPWSFLSINGVGKRNKWLKENNKKKLIEINKIYKRELRRLPSPEDQILKMEEMKFFIRDYPQFSGLIKDPIEFDKHLEMLYGWRDS